MKREIILRWLKIAEEDIKAAEYLLKAEDVCTSVVCFHSQQAVEKYLKAYLTYTDVRVKKIHDMLTILELCIEQDREFEKLDREKIAQLTFYAVDIRYPDEFYLPSLEEAKECFNVALDVKAFVLSKIKMEHSTDS